MNIDFAKYRAMGFTDEEIMAAAKDVQQNSLMNSYNEAMNIQHQDPRIGASNTLVSGQKYDDSFAKWQLELDSILERVEHMLRGDKPKFVNGSMIYVPTDNPKERIFNDFGISEIMRVLSMYVNRNTILSNYDEETINGKVLNFGKELRDLIYLKYEDMGLDTLEKRKLYPMMVRQLVDIVHSAYLRALNGMENRGLRETRNVTENITPMGGMQMPMPMMRERSIINPARYIFGKYKG